LRATPSVRSPPDTVALLDGGSFEEPSTKRASEVLDKWGADRPVLVVLDAEEVGALKSFRNMQRVTVLPADAIGVADVVGARSLVISKSALETVAARAEERS
jgi:large subunit ribosomal protein L4